KGGYEIGQGVEFRRVVFRSRSDAQVLRCFAAGGEEDAFATLVERHGPLVWGVCRRVLRHHHDAEDAFQATFLVLARNAAAIRKRSEERRVGKEGGDRWGRQR